MRCGELRRCCGAPAGRTGSHCNATARHRAGVCSGATAVTGFWGAQGHHPFPYALAELIDNALRATRRNGDRPRTITVSMVVSTGRAGSSARDAVGLVSIHDNGSGMTKREVNQWAVMNLSMEDRGLRPAEAEASGRGASGSCGRFINGDLSYFGVRAVVVQSRGSALSVPAA
jgi:Histidine kinase-, DNA gyrase B-, and HSP90-like ATPase